MDKKIYYFDILPLHPKPEPLESFTSYLTRLAEINGLESLTTGDLLYRLLEISQVTMPKDYPLQSFGKMHFATTVTEAALQETTFYHFGKKFGRSSLPRALLGLLAGSLARSLRYCPKCLAEYGYRSLIWRFLALQGCYKHSCRLLNECSHCGQAIPIFVAPFKIGICPQCNGDLRTRHSETLSEEACEEARIRSRDLEFLLLPEPWETTIDSLPQRVGRQLARLRQEKHFTVENVCNQIRMTKGVLEAAEYGLINPQGTSFQLYCKYADLLGVTFYDIFDIALQQEDDNARLRIRKGWIPLSEEEVNEQIKMAIEKLSSQGEQITQKAICEVIHINRARLKGYPRALAFLKQTSLEVCVEREKNAEKHHNEKLSLIMKAVRHLEEVEECVTYDSVAQIVGVHRSYFNYHKQAREIVEQSTYRYPNYRALQFQKREGELIAKIEAVIQQLDASGQPITWKAVGRIVGMRPTNLKAYPRIKVLIELSINKKEQRRKRKEELILKVEEAIRQLEALGQPVTQSSIGKIIGTSRPGFMQYGEIKKLLQLCCRDASIQSGFSEDEIMERVQNAIQQLEVLGQRVTQKSIGKIVKMGVASLKKYPRVKDLLEHYKQLSQSEKERLAELHEDEVVMAVERAIRKLEESKLIITRAAIGIIVGLSVSSLVHYPRVKSLLNRYTNLHQKFLRASTQSEEELIEQVKAAIQQLQAANRPVTQIAIGAIVSKHPAILKRYPKVNALFKQINNKNRQARSAQSERREDQLVVKVESAIRQLEDSNLPITQTAISKIVGMPETAMYYYPDVISLLKKTVKEKKHQQAMEEARLREKALIERVLMAEAQLRSLGKSVSKTAISKIIHVSQSTFNNYPSAKAILQQIVANKS